MHIEGLPRGERLAHRAPHQQRRALLDDPPPGLLTSILSVKVPRNSVLVVGGHVEGEPRDNPILGQQLGSSGDPGRAVDLRDERPQLLLAFALVRLDIASQVHDQGRDLVDVLVGLGLVLGRAFLHQVHVAVVHGLVLLIGGVVHRIVTISSCGRSFSSLFVLVGDVVPGRIVETCVLNVTSTISSSWNLSFLAALLPQFGPLHASETFIRVTIQVFVSLHALVRVRSRRQAPSIGQGVRAFGASWSAAVLLPICALDLDGLSASW